MSSEETLIERVCRKLCRKLSAQPDGRHGRIAVGIGDDAAVLRPRAGMGWAVTTDAFLENVHFLRNVHPPAAVGYKALARATSDLAAMGAHSRYFLLGLALPEACTGKWLDDFLDGMARAAGQFELTLVGGDTTKYPSIMANLTVIGEIHPERAVLRSGARPGDPIYVSGRLGEAELGWQLLRRGLYKKHGWKHLLTKHLYPEPRLALGQWLVKNKCVTAMIDTSDGLSTDLGHVCKASGVGAKLWAEKIPVARVPPQLQKRGLDPLQLAVDGGEDYELLFTVPKRLAGRLPAKVRGVPITQIGEITQKKGIVLVDSASRNARSKLLRPGGWDPFRRPRRTNPK